MAEASIDSQSAVCRVPVWVAVGLTITNAVDFVKFGAAVAGRNAAEGLLTVYWNTKETGMVEERVASPGWQSWASHSDPSAAAGAPSKASLLRIITGTSFGPSVFHHDGSILQPAGWYDANGVLNNDFPLQPGRAYIFFITAGNSVRWRQAVPYAP